MNSFPPSPDSCANPTNPSGAVVPALASPGGGGSLLARDFKLTDKPPAGYGFIYKITSPSGKAYIGQTIRSVECRVRQHSMFKKKICQCIFRAIRKYGIDSMFVEVIDVVAVGLLNVREMELIKSHLSKKPHGYNLTDGGEGARGRIATFAARLRTGEATKQRWAKPGMREKMRKGLANHIWTKEQKEHLSFLSRQKKLSPRHKQALLTANIGRKFSAESKQRMRDAQLRRFQKPEEIDKLKAYMKRRMSDPEERAKVISRLPQYSKLAHNNGPTT